MSNYRTPSNFKDLTGQTFGKWKVIKRDKNKNDWKVYWICECQCEKHTIKSVYSGSLLKGLSKSCGCIKTKTIKEKLSKRCKYIFHKDCVEGITQKGQHFFVDIEDYHKIKKYNWHTDEHGYLKTKNNGDFKVPFTEVFLHAYLLDFPRLDGQDIDHIDKDPFNNQKNNFRIITHQQNTFNHKIAKNNSSGYSGVSFNKRRGKWESYITINRKKKNLGRHENIDDAIKARLKAELELYGKDFAPQRHLFKQYGIEVDEW